MKKYFCFLFFLLWTCMAFSQRNGAINVYAYMSNTGMTSEGDENVFVLVQQGKDTIRHERYIDTAGFEMNHLAPGIYRVTLKNREGVIFYSREVDVLPGEVTEVILSYRETIERYEYDEEGADDNVIDKGKIILNGNAFYGSNFSAAKENPVRNEFGMGFRYGFIYAPLRHLGLGGNWGIDFSHAYFSKDSSMLSLENRKFERYTNLDINATLMLRFSSGNQQKEYKQGVFLDLGAIFHFPILRNHVVHYPDLKIINKNFYSYTDLRLMTRLGFRNSAVFFEYSLVDFVKDKYPDFPLFRIGVSFQFESN